MIALRCSQNYDEVFFVPARQGGRHETMKHLLSYRDLSRHPDDEAAVHAVLFREYSHPLKYFVI
tara:strand:+ start:76232 stop:76423 length:192 start_codon:yes stop_codon:yes gene_type:complete